MVGDAFDAGDPERPEVLKVSLRWSARIPLRDGIHLNATIHRATGHILPASCIVTLTPYGADVFHEQGKYFAENGYHFATVDVRGRGNSEGEFRPHLQEAQDGFDVVEWLARQPYCNGTVAMWGGSYSGYAQWVTAAEGPPHLTTIVPAASPYIGVDVPMRNNIFPTEVMQYLTLVDGRTTQWNLYRDREFWATQSRSWWESGRPFRDFDSMLGDPSPLFQEYLSHPCVDAYWDAHNPTAEQYSKLRLPILTITGIYDDDQPGALAHYKEYMKHAPDEGRARHYLIIGPWDHAGTRAPKQEFGGLVFGPASLIDMSRLHLEWYTWIIGNGPKPAFLQNRVAYYVMGAEQWRYANTLEDVTAKMEAYYLGSVRNPTDVFRSGSIDPTPPTHSGPDHYIYNPDDVDSAELQGASDLTSLVDQRLVYESSGKHLVYHSEAFENDIEVSGFFELSAWLAIDQPDTDFNVSIHEIQVDGSSILLTTDRMRARYRETLREPNLIRTKESLRYDFTRFTFVSRRVQRGSRLRLVIGPINSIFSEKNFNSGGIVAEESARDGRPVTVFLYHDVAHPSVLYVPIGRVDS